MLKKIAYPGSYYDDAGFERWLSDRSAEGLRLEEFSSIGGIPVFQVQERRRMRYYVEADIRKKGRRSEDELEAAYIPQGWYFVARKAGEVLIYETDDLCAVKPSRNFEEADLERKWRSLWKELAFWIVMNGLSIFGILSDLSPLSTMDWSVSLAQVMILAGTLILFTLWPAAAKLYDICIWNRCVRQGEEPDHWRGMSVFRWGEVVTFWLLIAALLLALFVLL